MRTSGLPVCCLLLALSGCGSDDKAEGSGGAGGQAGSGGATGGSGGSTGGAAGGGGAAGSGGSLGGEIGPNAAECQLATPPADPVCEAGAGASCFYVDPSAGDDPTGDGSYAKPWRTLANVVTYYGTPGEQGSTPKPSTAIDLQPGDFVYLLDGTLSDLYNYQGQTQIARFRTKNGSDSARFHLKAYPGRKPVFDPGGSAPAIVLAQSSYWEISGIEIANAYGTGLRIEETDQVSVSHMHIHDTDGVDNNNIAGLYLVGAENVDVSCSLLHDNYDRENADTGGTATENSSNVVAFGGGNIRIHHNRVYQSPAPSSDKTGGCIKYKHAASVADGSFEVDHNDISSCKFFGVGSGTQHTHVHHNLIYGGSSLVSRDFGGPTHQTDQHFDHNTIYMAGGLGMNPTDDWVDATFDDPKDIQFSSNIVVHDLAKPSQENGIIVIGTYGPDALYDKTLPELSFTSNCYFNPSGPLSFALFAANGGNYGSKGNQYALSDWQGLGFDTDSVNADPMLVDPAGGDFTLQAGSPCTSMGAYAP